MSIEQIQHKGKTIFYLDFKNIKDEAAILSKVNIYAQEIRKQPIKSALTITDVGNMHFNNTIKNAFTDLSKGNAQHVKAGTVCGLNGLGHIVLTGLLKIAKRDIKSFQDIEDAKEYLINQ